MVAIGIKALKNRLSEYVRLAASGETVLVLDRKRMVAEIHPPSPGRHARIEDARLADGVRRGYLTPPRAPRSGPRPRCPQAPLAELDKGRAER
jgi:antitoxin (DNA-binding transcriptional repressor) of toxin-antitoxin stability system